MLKFGILVFQIDALQGLIMANSEESITEINLIPLKGVNQLLFGATMLEAEALFGPPSDIETLDEIPEYKSIVWHYWQKGFSLFFDDNERNTFSCVEVDGHHAKLWGKNPFTLNEKQLLALFAEKGFTEIDAEDQAWGERRVSVDDATVDMYFDKGQLTSISCAIAPHIPNELMLPN